MHTLDSSNDTSIPAFRSMPVLRFAMWSRINLAPPLPILPGDSDLTAPLGAGHTTASNANQRHGDRGRIHHSPLESCRCAKAG
jgi:hypothetical protein